MAKEIKVLIIEDNEDDALLEISELRSAGFSPVYTRIQSLKELKSALRGQSWDCIISDYAMPQFSGLEAYHEFKQHAIDIPFILVSGTMGEDIAVEAMKTGVHDYIMKDNLVRLAPALERELRESELRRNAREKEVAFNKSETKYAVLVENAKDYIFMIDQECRFISINSMGAKLFDKRAEQITGRRIDDVFPPHLTDEYLRNLQSVFMTGIHDEHEGYMIVGDKKLWVRTIMSPVLDENGEIGAVLCVAKDLTEKLRAELQIKENEQYLSMLFNTLSDAIITVMFPDRIITHANNAVKKITGYDPEELIGQQTKILYPSMDNFLWYGEKVNKAIRNGKMSMQDEIILQKKGGEMIWCDLRHTFLESNENASSTSSIVVLRDITEKKMMLDELVASKEKAEEMSRLKSSFLANMSHELRTPMIGILGFSELLVEEAKDPEIKQWALSINHGSRRLMDTLNVILDFSCIEAGKLQLEVSNFDAVDAVAQICESFREAIENKYLYLSVQFEMPHFNLITDKRLFTEVIKNLISNAIKFTDRGGVSVLISVGKDDDSPGLIVQVSDTGVGIAEENLHLIWDEFRQASEGHGRSYEGTGLGLTISKKFVEKMGGEITVTSTLNVGSVFTVRVPNAADFSDKILPESAELSTPAIVEASELPKFPGPHYKVLYVEDDPIAFRVVSRILKDLCICDIALNSREALNKVAENMYDCILMDIHLGHGDDGMTTVAAIRQMDNYRSVPIVAVTAYAMAGNKEEFLSKGCSHYMAKPFKKSDIINLMQSILINK